MNKKMLSGLSLLLSAGVYAGTASALEGDPEAGKQVSATCVACHQADGMGKNNAKAESWPRLAGLPEAYIAKQLHDFKSGERNNASMAAFASMLDEQKIADVSAYYAGLEDWPELPTAYHAADPDDAPSGWLIAATGKTTSSFPPAASATAPTARAWAQAFRRWPASTKPI